MNKNTVIYYMFLGEGDAPASQNIWSVKLNESIEITIFI